MREGFTVEAPNSPHPLGTEYTREDNVVGSCCSAGVYREADARLICAAPDLLEACKTLLKMDCCDGYEPKREDFVHLWDAISRAHEAVAKAEGRK